MAVAIVVNIAVIGRAPPIRRRLDSAVDINKAIVVHVRIFQIHRPARTAIIGIIKSDGAVRHFIEFGVLVRWTRIVIKTRFHDRGTTATTAAAAVP